MSDAPLEDRRGLGGFLVHVRRILSPVNSAKYSTSSSDTGSAPSLPGVADVKLAHLQAEG